MAYQIREDYQSATSANWYRRQYAQSWRTRFSDWGEQRAFRKLLNQVPANQTVLDIACGTGRFTDVLLRDGHQVTGSDVSTEMLRIAQQQLGHHAGLVSFEVGDAEALPYQDNAFDGIVCIRLYQRVPAESRQRMLAEVERVGKGWAILFFGMSTPWLDIRRAIRLKIARRPNVRYPATPESLKQELREAGLSLKSQAWAMRFVSEGLLVLVTWEHDRPGA